MKIIQNAVAPEGWATVKTCYGCNAVLLVEFTDLRYDNKQPYSDGRCTFICPECNAEYTFTDAPSYVKFALKEKQDREAVENLQNILGGLIK